MRIAYVDCPSGVAGDMLLGGLIDAGADVDVIRRSLDALEVGGWELRIGRAERAGIAATRIEVVVAEGGPARDHAELKRVIESAQLPPGVRRRALNTFQVLAEAEGKVHGVDIDAVHFHEVGGIDALVDIVGCCAAIESLALDRIVTSALPSGSGTVATTHGVLPVPAPAVMEILRGVPMYGSGEGETVTPTGAALLVANSDAFGSLPAMQVGAVGYGAGSRDTEIANVTRIIVGESIDEPEAPTHLLVETNIDDMAPELIPYALERLLAAGAADAWVTPIMMKKGRPAFTVSALVTEADTDAVLDALFRETTTFGARIQPVGKAALPREWIEVEVAAMPVRIKIARRGGDVVTAAPEYEDAAKVARATGMALKDVYAEALRAYDRVKTG